VKTNVMNPNRTQDDEDRTRASPDGPQPRGVDEAAGGADSSPLETESTDRRRQKADEERRKGRDAATSANEAP
jgi:hypothetical protein